MLKLFLTADLCNGNVKTKDNHRKHVSTRHKGLNKDIIRNATDGETDKYEMLEKLKFNDEEMNNMRTEQ